MQILNMAVCHEIGKKDTYLIDLLEITIYFIETLK